MSIQNVPNVPNVPNPTLPRVDYQDVFAADLPGGVQLDAEGWTRLVFRPASLRAGLLPAVIGLVLTTFIAYRGPVSRANFELVVKLGHRRAVPYLLNRALAKATAGAPAGRSRWTA